jgi:hypothetical protein
MSRFSVTHSDGSVTRHSSHSAATEAANASAARSGASVQDTTGRGGSSGAASSGGGSSGGGSSLAPTSSPAPAPRAVSAPAASSGGGSSAPSGYTSLRDYFDGGGPGQSGSEFGGLLGGVSNRLGLAPMSSGDRSGGVYQGPNIDGSSGYMQDPGRMTVDPQTGFITSDSNPFIAAQPEPPPFDFMAYLNSQGDSSPGPIAMPPAQMPIAEPPVEEAPAMAQMLPPGYQMAGLGDVSADPESMFTFEQYLASLNRAPGVIPPPLMAMPAQMDMGLMGQGIGSLAPQPVQLMNMGGAVSAPMPQMFEDPMMRLGPRLPPMGFAG